MGRDQARDTGVGGRHDRLRTSCGRQLTIGRLALGDARRPAARVFVDIGECSGCETSAWAGLTVPEARLLARALLAQAAAAERECPASPQRARNHRP
ncbi:MAG TPA: hypothetical protein VMI73_11260 [Trebonia sp.]|nr:hypothetical protein [Trebonia sp.]